MSSDTYEGALRAFIADLRRAWHTAGRPSYQDLEVLSAQVLKHNLVGQPELVQLASSTVNGIFREQRVHPPKWPRVLTLVVVLHEAARRAGADPARIGSVAGWKRRHEALCAAERVGSHDAEEDARFGEILELVRRAGEPQWWHEYRDMAPGRLGFYLHLESIANVIRMYTTRVVPGLLQVEAYSDALTRRMQPAASEREIARRVELRLRRQQNLNNRQSCQLWVIMEEAALRNRYLGSPVMRTQLRHLIKIAERPNIRLQILRDDSGDNDTIKEPLAVLRFPEPHLGDVAFLGPREPDGLVLHGRKDVQHYSQLLSYLGTRACKAQETTDLLRAILADT